MEELQWGFPIATPLSLNKPHINEWKVKRRIRMDPRIREGDEGGELITGTRASEAKGPFPGGKRVGSWGKKKIVKANVIEKIKAQRLDHVIGSEYSESFWLNINNLPCSYIKLFEFRKVNLNKYTRCGIQILKMNPDYWACRINVKYFGR
jgi:hypothetical protein